jgi:glycerol-3-phosphate O-acyltransferase
MIYRFSLLLLVLSSANAFVPPAHHNQLSSQRYSSETQAESVTNKEASNDLTPEYNAALQKAEGAVSAVLKDTQPELIPPLLHFAKEYISAHQASYAKNEDERNGAEAAMKRILEGVQFGFKYGLGPEKYVFGVAHEALRGDPETEDGNEFDFYEWGSEFFRGLMDKEESKLLGMKNLENALEQAKNGENVVFFANHQSEADPQVVSILLERAGLGEQAPDIYYVAGHKVTTDALAIPFSMGRNLICIHSKKHIEADPDTKGVKNRQNLDAMSGMLKRLRKGGCILWVAPSGGRDRRDLETGKTPIAPFDSKTLDMFRLMGNKSKKPTHYYPFAMVSYEVCPPPDFVEAGVGEQRNFRFTPVGINVGEEISSEGGLEQRHEFNDKVYEETLKEYHELRELIFPGTAPPLE